jgi:hypothetical protein
MTDMHAMTTTPLTRAFAPRPGAGSSRAYLGHLRLTSGGRRPSR